MRLPKLDPALLREHHVLVKADDAFQQRARLTQALWRERHGHPIGLHRGAPLGSSMDLDYAERTLANFLTETNVAPEPPAVAAPYPLRRQNLRP